MGKFTRSVCISTVAVFLMAGLASAVTYSGSLSGAADGNGGLITTGPWSSTSTVLSWEVTDETTEGCWAYKYTFTACRKDIWHILIEASDTFTKDDILTTNWDRRDICVDTFSDGLSNPNLPAAIYAVKFDDIYDDSVTVCFTTDRAPVWGDFYAKDGIALETGDDWWDIDLVCVTAWNKGFTAVDPTDAPSKDRKSIV